MSISFSSWPIFSPPQQSPGVGLLSIQMPGGEGRLMPVPGPGPVTLTEQNNQTISPEGAMIQEAVGVHVS